MAMAATFLYVWARTLTRGCRDGFAYTSRAWRVYHNTTYLDKGCSYGHDWY